VKTGSTLAMKITHQQRWQSSVDIKYL